MKSYQSTCIQVQFHSFFTSRSSCTVTSLGADEILFKLSVVVILVTVISSGLVELKQVKSLTKPAVQSSSLAELKHTNALTHTFFDSHFCLCFRIYILSFINVDESIVVYNSQSPRHHNMQSSRNLHFIQVTICVRTPFLTHTNAHRFILNMHKHTYKCAHVIQSHARAHSPHTTHTHTP